MIIAMKGIISEIVVVRQHSYILEKISHALRKIMNFLGVIDEMKIFDSIIIKLNLCDARTPDTGTITHPVILEALLKILREVFPEKRIMAAEGDSGSVLADLYIKWFGFEEILRKYDAEWVNLLKVKRIKKRIDGYYFKEIEVPAVFEGAYFITLPKLKTNIVTGITASLKNQYGCLCVLKKNVYHDVVDEVIVDINLAIKPHLCIVDGIVGMGGVQGPAFGIPIPAGVLIGGKDPVAVDALCARIIGFNPRSIKHIKLAAKAGLGSLKYRVVGDPMPRVNF